MVTIKLLPVRRIKESPLSDAVIVTIPDCNNVTFGFVTPSALSELKKKKTENFVVTETVRIDLGSFCAKIVRKLVKLKFY